MGEASVEKNRTKKKEDTREPDFTVRKYPEYININFTNIGKMRYQYVQRKSRT